MANTEQGVGRVVCSLRWDHGSTIEGFLEHLFGDQTERACVIAVFFSEKGRAVQMWNSIRYLEASCRLCKAMSQREIEELRRKGQGMPCSGSCLLKQGGSCWIHRNQE